jgi:hypothetical protein
MTVVGCSQVNDGNVCYRHTYCYRDVEKKQAEISMINERNYLYKTMRVKRGIWHLKTNVNLTTIFIVTNATVRSKTSFQKYYSG